VAFGRLYKEHTARSLVPTLELQELNTKSLLCLSASLIIQLLLSLAVCSQILPYRPEPWAILARLYRVEKSDFAKCYGYAAAGLAQGAPLRDALFLNTNVSINPAVVVREVTPVVGGRVGLGVGEFQRAGLDQPEH